MNVSRRRLLSIAVLSATAVAVNGCFWPWRSEHHHERHERRDDRYDERKDDHQERKEDHQERDD